MAEERSPTNAKSSGGNKHEIVLAMGIELCDNVSMKYILSFLIGVVLAVWLFPPAPTVEIDNMTRREIAYKVIEYLEQEHFDTIAAKRGIVLAERRSWF